MASFPKLSSGSMTVSPSLGSTSMAKYPATFEHAWKTRTVRFLNDQEQSWSVRPRLFGATLQYSKMSGYDTSLVRDFLILQKGRFVDTALANVFDMEFAGVVYTNMVFDQDDFSATVDGSETFTFQIKVRQLISSFSSPGPGGVAPSFSFVVHISSSASISTYSPAFYADFGERGIGIVPFLLATGPWALRDDSISVSPPPTSVYGNAVGLTIQGALSGSGLSQWFVNDIRAVVTYPDGTTFTVRPTQSLTQAPATNVGDAAIADAANAYDGDPATFATISRTVFAPLTLDTFFQFIF